jgi:uncharacterized membrane protein YgcG
VRCGKAGLVGLLTVVFVVLGAGVAHAEAITGERVDLTAGRDGVLHVVERIDYDFGVIPHHGIFREIPVREHYDKRYDRKFPISNITVTASEGTPAPFTTSTTGAWLTIKIGDKNRTITGVHRYVIRYDVRGALTAFPDHDELFWNALGSRWPVVRNNALVIMHMPARVTRVGCYSGPVNSRLACEHASANGSVARFTDSMVFSGDELSVVAALPRGTISPRPAPILVERWSFDRAFTRSAATVSGSVALLAFLLVLAIGTMWRVGRDRRFRGSAVDVAFGSADGSDERVGLFEDTSSPVEYEPPDGIRPGEIGTLIDERANPLDATATIVDLAVRGYLVIEEIPKHGWLGKADWKLTKQKDADGLLEYERSLFNALFRNRDEVTLSALRRTFATSLAKVESKLYDDAVKHGWFLRRPDHVRAMWRALGIALLIIGIALTIVVARFTHAGLLPVPLAILGLVVVAGAHNMPCRTAKGTGTLRRVLGFREFIEQSEKERARFAEQQNLFSEYLPYAIVFGAVHKWAKAFEGLADQAPETMSWYRSSEPFSTLAFAHAIDGFTVTTTGTISAAAPSSSGGSSGFSGGGFSGGGGGGGGGGSW